MCDPRPNPPGADSHATLVLLPGTHYVTSKISMNQRDSHIVIKSLNSDEVALSGGELIWLIGLTSWYLSTCSFQEEQSSTVGGQRMEGSRRPHSRAPVERPLWGSRDLSRPEVPTWPTSTQLSTWPMLPTTQSRFAISCPA